MKILSYKKKKNGLYCIYLEQDKEISLYEEVLLDQQILLKKELSQEELENLYHENKKWESYYQALSILKKHLKTKKEIENYLKEKGFTLEEIEKTIQKLTDQGYLNDLNYAKSYVHYKLTTSNHGPLFIRKELEGKKISKDNIDIALSVYTKEEEKQKIYKIISTKLKSNHKKSTFSLRKSLEIYLSREGFCKDLINEALEKIYVSNEEELKKQEYERIYQKLSKKYKGKELEYKVRQKMFQLGFSFYD